MGGNPRDNGFDVIRLGLAVLVVYTHGCLICGYGPEPTYDWIKRQYSFGSLAVLGFFGISGYLVTASWERSPGVWVFLRSRALRIFPAFWVCLIVIATAVGPLLHVGRGMPLGDYPLLGPGGAVSFVRANSLLAVGQWSIGDTLDGAPYSESLDGSLWSIFPEFICYLLTAALGLLGAGRENRSLLAGFIGFVGVLHVIHVLQPVPYTPSSGPTLLMLGKGPMYYLAYLAGAGLWAFRDVFRPNFRGCLFAGVALTLTLKFGGLLLIAPFALPVCVVYLAFSFTCRLRWDLSYGVYLYHFPLMQLLALNAWLRERTVLFLAVGLAGSLALAAASWLLVEAPALRYKGRPGAKRALPARECVS